MTPACSHTTVDVPASRHFVCRGCKTDWPLKLYWMRAYANAATGLMTKIRQDEWLLERHARPRAVTPLDDCVEAYEIGVRK